MRFQQGTLEKATKPFSNLHISSQKRNSTQCNNGNASDSSLCAFRYFLSQWNFDKSLFSSIGFTTFRYKYSWQWNRFNVTISVLVALSSDICFVFSWPYPREFYWQINKGNSYLKLSKLPVKVPNRI